MIDADAIAYYLASTWGMPIGTTATPPSRPFTFSPTEVVQRAIAAGDLRLVRALPCWLSVLDEPAGEGLKSDGSEDDRRRLAYLCELAGALRCLRERHDRPVDDDWPMRVAGIRPSAWDTLIPLCSFHGPAVTPSAFGIKWGILEPMVFPEYVAFQDQYLELERTAPGGSRAEP